MIIVRESLALSSLISFIGAIACWAEIVATFG